MPHASVKLKPGVNENATPALNEAGISSSNLVRFRYSPDGVALVEKLGGWSKYFPDTMPAVPRALWAWADTNAVPHLAVGTENISTYANLSVISEGLQDDITPRYDSDSIEFGVSGDFDTTAASYVVTVTDTVTLGITDFDAVYIKTHVSIGGLIMFGLYQCYTDGADTYFIHAADKLGRALPAPSTSGSGAVAIFDSTSGQTAIEVTLPDHGFLAGDTYPVLVSTSVGGVTLYGNYIVQSVIDPDTFTINASNTASATATVSINGGDAAFVYSFGIGSVPVSTTYGSGGYGSGGYGGFGFVASTGDPIPADDWTLDNWGQELVACPVSDGTFQPVYVWDPTGGEPIATAIPQSPPVNDGIFVAMPQRQIIAWGSTFTGIQDPLLVRWCDVGNYNSWIGTPTNQAGSYRLPRGSRIVGALQGPQQAFVWTDLGVWAMQYIALPYVYSFNQVGTGCGLIGRKAAAALNNDVYWMGPSAFYMLTEGGMQRLPCPVWDIIFQNLDTDSVDKIRACVNSRFGEISWEYPTTDSNGEVAAYAKFNVILNAWDVGTLARSAWIDQSVLGPPVGADPNTLYLQQHEISPDADGAAMEPTFRTGYFAMADGDRKIFVDQVWPDFKWGYYDGAQNATLNITFYVCDYPGETPTAYGPFSVTQATKFVTPRFRGRLVSIEIGSSDTGSFWRLGNIRYRLQPDGKF